MPSLAGPTRRALLSGALAAAGASALPFSSPVGADEGSLAGLPARAGGPDAPRTHRLTLVAAERDAEILGPAQPRSRVWSFAPPEQPVIPVIRAAVGDRLLARLENRLPQHTSVHWHGIRVPNGMDGVPYVTQPPVLPGHGFDYDIPLEDTGTFFLHPHCDESGQTGRGLMAVLVVEGDAPPGYADADLVLAVKDWRLAGDGTFLPFDTKDGAGRAGTFGTVRGTNGQAGPMRASVPTGGLVRLRVLNVDPTRILQLGVEGGEAALVATDGHALQPTALNALTDGVWRLGPAMRADLLVQAPAQAGDTVRIMDYGSAEPWLAAELTAEGPRIRHRPFEPRPLYAAQIPRVPDLGAAERLSFTFGASSGADAAAAVAAGLPPGDPLARVLLDTLCVRDTSLWAINRTPWPAGPNAAVPPPLGTLTAGRSYVAEWINTTPHPHPIHLHGHTFEVLSYSRQKGMPRHLADTALVNPRERVEVAFVAAPGDWMLHCHIVEHLEYGMMGYLRVA